jgi:hypothetical protein
LQIPHDVPPIQLREHLRNLLDMRWVDPSSSPKTSATLPIGIITSRRAREKEPSDHEERYDGKGEQGRDIYGWFNVCHV